jgi:bifunctional non-homologous end joining protein LigD
MLVASGPLRPDSDKYAFEVKWDGFRALVDASPQGITIASRNGYDMTDRYPELQGLRDAVSESVLLDGEIVALNGAGKPDFAALWFRSRGSTDPGAPLCFMVFDVLQLGDEALISWPYGERREVLEDLSLGASSWCIPEVHIGDGKALFAATKAMRLEGVVAKRLDSRYQPGVRSTAWIKTKHFQTRTFALLGWLPPGEWRADRGCVVLGLRSSEGVTMSGVVETGYGPDLVEQLPRLTRPELRALQQPGQVWMGKNALVGEVKFLEWSPAGGLRHATLVSIFA